MYRYASSAQHWHARYYAARAAEYDASVGYGTPRFEAAAAPLKARLANILRHTDLLEIACGTGYWTRALAPHARSMVAVDRDAASLQRAGLRLASCANVRLQLADAYSLEGINGSFNAAFAMFWWSHVPKSKLPVFLKVLVSKLEPGSPVVFVDQLPYRWDGSRRFDDEGNLLEERRLRDGSCYEVVKNFPTESEVGDALSSFAIDVQYYLSPDGHWWMVHCVSSRRR
jgi:demethylmenaquinone methyltransferase/2-methoxy-6-polyprenyl-1,4-benzoquinol methylase